MLARIGEIGLSPNPSCLPPPSPPTDPPPVQRQKPPPPLSPPPGEADEPPDGGWACGAGVSIAAVVLAAWDGSPLFDQPAERADQLSVTIER